MCAGRDAAAITTFLSIWPRVRLKEKRERQGTYQPLHSAIDNSIICSISQVFSRVFSR